MSQCYRTFVRPNVEYASAIWDPARNKQLQYQLEQVQIKKARRIESNWDYKSIASNMGWNLGLNFLTVTKKVARLKMLHSIYHSSRLDYSTAFKV